MVYPFADHIYARQHRAFIKNFLYINKDTDTDTEDSKEPAPEVKTGDPATIGLFAEIALNNFTRQQ